MPSFAGRFPWFKYINGHEVYHAALGRNSTPSMKKTEGNQSQRYSKLLLQTSLSDLGCHYTNGNQNKVSMIDPESLVLSGIVSLQGGLFGYKPPCKKWVWTLSVLLSLKGNRKKRGMIYSRLSIKH